MNTLPIHAILQVAAGGALGASMRFALGLWMTRSLGSAATTYPYATLCINLSGSLCLGILAGLIFRDDVQWQGWLLFAGVGVLGGFTTFSTFSLEIVMMLERGDAFGALSYMGLSVVGGVAALWLGLALTRSIA